jgi:hypothetical protein
MSDVSVGLDDLPRYSAWPARLLGLEPWQPKRKTRDEVLREFDREKWGSLLDQAQRASTPPTLEDVVLWSLEGIPPSLVSVGDRWEVLSAAESRTRYIEVVASELRKYAPASALLELGAGFGSVLFALARQEPFSKMSICGGELTESGRALLALIAKGAGLDWTLGLSDLGAARVLDVAVPEQAIVFTSYAVHYLQEVTGELFAALASLKPRVVVHFEPCFEHCDETSLLGLLRRRYIEVNDYNRNFVHALLAEERKGTLRVIEQRPAVFGGNPLLAASVLAWEPRSR